MKRKHQPFMGGHVANIALSKAIGLRFLCSSTQTTCGQTGISQIAHLLDQLRVARWMLLSFLVEGGVPHYSGTEDEEGVEPWVAIDPFTAENATGMMFGAMTFENSEMHQAFRSIQDEVPTSEDGEWIGDSDEGRAFMLKLSVQLFQCILYLQDLVELVRTSLSFPVGDEESGASLAEALIHGRPYFVTMLQGQIHPGMACHMFKDAVPHERVFAAHLLALTLKLIRPEAVNCGYAYDGPKDD